MNDYIPKEKKSQYILSTLRPAALKDRHQRLVKHIMEAFYLKQKLKTTHWVNDIAGGTAIFDGPMVINFIDIVHDVTEKVPPGMITQWVNVSEQNPYKSVPYKQWLKETTYKPKKIKRDYIKKADYWDQFQNF
jgi:hypothetical protein